MRKPTNRSSNESWNEAQCKQIIEQLWALRERMLQNESDLSSKLQQVHATYRDSARNLAHYLALRTRDQRGLQAGLSRLGLSSLGRSESHVLANLDKVLGILHHLSGQEWVPRSQDEPVGIHSSRKLLDRHSTDMLGAAPAERAVRIMVTLPSDAASDFGLVRRLVASGMDIARINCAHDGPAEWKAMAAHVRRAAKTMNRAVRILMDLGGPKLRTGVQPPGISVLKLKPQRDEIGQVLAPALLGLRPAGSAMPVAGAHDHVGVSEAWLRTLKEGDVVECSDARGAQREWRVLQVEVAGVLVECTQTTYLVNSTMLQRQRKGSAPRNTAVADLPSVEGQLHLHRGDRLRVTGPTPAKDATTKRRGRAAKPLAVECTLPQVFGQVCVGERIWFDDGRIGGLIRQVDAQGLEVEITHARDVGEKLLGDKGINLPDSQLTLPALTEKDKADLALVAQEADMVGLSFVQQAADVDALRSCLNELGRPELGILLKIETRRAFENLPELLFSVMGVQAAGVMIARGDLAVECGYERLAEVQEEILWAAEAAHMPVVWATQVLETLAKTGLPSRAEITDAAMGERAECVMLNKGPHITDAMHTLDDILRRMQAHQSKKRPLLRALGAWAIPSVYPKPT
jgi:pyruvate kinase